MSASPERQAAILGLFVAIGLALVVGTLALIGGLGDRLTRTVPIAATFDQVSGLQPGDAVWSSGVKIGTVEDVRMVAPRTVEVHMAIALDQSRFVSADAVARVGSDGLIGNPIVVLADGIGGTRPIRAGDRLAVAPSASPDQVLATFQRNNENLVAVTEDLKALSTRLAAGEGTVGRLLADDALLDDVGATVAVLRDAALEARAVGRDLSAWTDALDDEGTLPHGLATDRATWPRVTGAVDRLSAAAEDAATLVDGVEEGLADPGTPLGTLLHDRAAGSDLKQALADLEAAAALLEEDLEALQDTFLLRGAIRRKREGDEPPREEPEPEPEPEGEPPPPSSVREAPRDRPPS